MVSERFINIFGHLLTRVSISFVLLYLYPKLILLKMKKLIIGAIVSGLLLFIWQFLSWSMLNIHAPQFKYTPHQEQILSTLADHLQSGDYFLPTYKPGASQEQIDQVMKDAVGKPWASITYRSAFNANMGMNMFRGFMANVVAAFILCWLLLKITNLDFKTALLASLGVGLIGYIVNTYMNSIWFEKNSIPDLIDAVVSWGLVGLWLGWWFVTKKSSTT